MTTIRTIGQLHNLREDWDSLSSAFGSPMLDHDWITSAAESLHAEQDLRVFTVRQEGRLTAVAPMAIDRTDGRRLAVVGASRLFEPCGWLFSSTEALRELAGVVAREGVPVLLHRIPAASMLCANAAAQLKGRALVIARASAPSLGVDLAEAEALLPSSRTLKKLEGLRSRAERELGHCEVSVHAPPPHDVDRWLGTFASIEAAGWKGERGAALSRRPDMSRFFQAYAQRAAARGRLRVVVLSFGGNVAAMEIAVDAYDRRWGLKIAYDEQLARFAPALQLAHASIQTSRNAGLRSYEFLGVAESWQERWKPHQRPYQSLLIYPFSAFGGLGLASDALRAAWKRAGV